MHYFNLTQLTAIGIGVLVLLLFIGLILWNYKAKTQVKTLKSIDSKLEEVCVVCAVSNENDKEDKRTLENEGESQLEREPKLEPEGLGLEDCDGGDILQRTAKNGKVYDKIQLMEQIRN